MTQTNIPISIAVISARNELISEFNRIAIKYKLPASLLDGIMSSLLADIRSQELGELLNVVNQKQPVITESTKGAKENE